MTMVRAIRSDAVFGKMKIAQADFMPYTGRVRLHKQLLQREEVCDESPGCRYLPLAYTPGSGQVDFGSSCTTMQMGRRRRNMP